jgi:hypothetical protein
VTHLSLPRPGPRALRASVDAAVALRLHGCVWGALPIRRTFWGSGTGSAEQLTRLLLEDVALTELCAVELEFSHEAQMGWPAGAAPAPAHAAAHAAATLAAFCAALRGSRLTSLTLRGYALSAAHRHATVRAAAAGAAALGALAAALAGHPTLAALALRTPLHRDSSAALPGGAGAPEAPLPGVGAALAALATGGGAGAAQAGAGALTRLDVSGCGFLDAELAPLFAALAAGEAPRLRALDVGGSQLREHFVRAVLAPAAAAAASAGCLDELRLKYSPPQHEDDSEDDSEDEDEAAVAHPLQPLHAAAHAAWSGAERAVRARAAARAAAGAGAGRSFVFRAEHAPLCRAAPGDDVDTAAAGAPPLAPLARALARATGVARVVLGGPFASALARDELRAEDAASLLRALARHPGLEALTLEGDLHRAGEALGGALGALLAADAPSLTSLRVAGCALGDAGMAPLVAALPANTHLRALQCNGSALSAAFARDALLPAVRANASLRELSACEHEVWVRREGAQAAMACVRARSRQALDAPQQP